MAIREIDFDPSSIGKKEQLSYAQRGGRQVVRPLVNVTDTLAGIPQTAYQGLVRPALESKPVKEAMREQFGALLSPQYEKEQLPEELPILPNPGGIKNTLRPSLEKNLGKGVLEPEGFWEETADRAAMLLPHALMAYVTGGASAALPVVGRAVGSAVGAQTAKSLGAGVGGELVGGLVGDIVGGDPKALLKLTPKGLFNYVENKSNHFWKESETAAEKIQVNNKSIRDGLRTAELEITKTPPKLRTSAQKEAVRILQASQTRLKDGKPTLKKLIEERKEINQLFKMNMSDYEKGYAKFAHKQVSEAIDQVLDKSGNEGLKKNYGLALATSEAVGKSKDITKRLAESGWLKAIAGTSAGSALGTAFMIPKLLGATSALGATATVGAYARKKLGPSVPFLNPKLLPLLSDISNIAEKVPFDKLAFSQAMQTLVKATNNEIQQNKSGSKKQIREIDFTPPSRV